MKNENRHAGQAGAVRLTDILAASARPAPGMHDSSGPCARWLSALALVLSGALLVGMLWSYAASVIAYPYYVPWSTVEEWAYTLTTAGNYLNYGFFHSGLLQDCSNSPFLADHPVVYTHMPAGPDIVVALLLKATGNNYVGLRAILAGLFLLGLWCFYRFTELIFRRLGLPCAAFVILFVGPIAWQTVMERSIYALYPLLVFGPYLALDGYYRTGNKRHLALVAALALLSSLYIEYSLLTAVVVSWLMLHITRLIRVDRNHLALVMAGIGGGILLHLLQNVLFLGPEIFFKDVLLTLGNRVAGYPDKQALEVFYQQFHIVHHGSNAVDAGMIFRQISSNFESPLWRPCAFAAGLSLLLGLRKHIYRSRGILLSMDRSTIHYARSLVLLFVSMAASVLVPVLLFPAYSQEVSLNWSRANAYYFAVIQCALVAFALKQLRESSPFHLKSGRILVATRPVRIGIRNRHIALERAAHYAIWVVVLLAVVQAAARVWHKDWKEYQTVASVNLGPNAYRQLEDLRMYPGELYATNVNTPVVGLFTKAPGFGVCDDDAVAPSGEIDLARCRVGLMRQRHVYVKQQPRFFFLFAKGKLFPGFAKRGMIDGDAYEKLEARLVDHFAQVRGNELFRVFDLSQPARR